MLTVFVRKELDAEIRAAAEIRGRRRARASVRL
jgi:hypothetical protein